MNRLLTLTEFRALRDANALASIRARLPELEANYEAAKAERQRIGRAVSKIEARKERVPAHLEDEYKAAAWSWQRAYAAYTLALATLKRLS